MLRSSEGDGLVRCLVVYEGLRVLGSRFSYGMLSLWRSHFGFIRRISSRGGTCSARRDATQTLPGCSRLVSGGAMQPAPGPADGTGFRRFASLTLDLHELIDDNDSICILNASSFDPVVSYLAYYRRDEMD